MGNPSELPAVAALVVSADFDAARERIWKMAGEERYCGDSRTDLAQMLEHEAKVLARTNIDAARWLYERAIEVWYSWGAMATSGGDGASRAPLIRAAEARQKTIFGASGEGSV